MADRVLAVPEVIGVDGDEAPLAETDICAVVGWFAVPDKAALFADGWRPTGWGHTELGWSCMSDVPGIWARFEGQPVRAGLIPWRLIESLVAGSAGAVQLGLFAEVA